MIDCTSSGNVPSGLAWQISKSILYQPTGPSIRNVFFKKKLEKNVPHLPWSIRFIKVQRRHLHPGWPSSRGKASSPLPNSLLICGVAGEMIDGLPPKAEVDSPGELKRSFLIDLVVKGRGAWCCNLRIFEGPDDYGGGRFTAGLVSEESEELVEVMGRYTLGGVM